MQTKKNKIFHDVKTKSISMLSHTKILMEKYEITVVKMAMNHPTNHHVKLNYDHYDHCETCKFCLALHAFCPN
jgi:5'(3')-deoxyribonucleotidase